MAATTNVQIIISATDNASDTLNQVGNAVANAGNKMSAVKQGADIVANSFLALGAAGLVATGASVKLASDFQSSMLLIQTQAGASATEVKNMTQAVLDLAPAVGQTPQELAQGLFFVESAGYRGAKALDVLKLSAEGAAVGHDDLISVVKALTSVVTSEISGVKDTTQAMGVLDAIVGHGKMTMSDLTSAMSTGILPAAKQVGLSLQDVGAALDVMTNNGIPAQEAATRLRMTLSLMEDPTNKAAKSLASVGLSSRSLADDMAHGGIIQAITDLNNHMNATQQGTDTIVKGTKMSASALLNLGDSILTTNDRLKTLEAEHGKTGQAAQNLADQIKTTQDKLGEYTAKLGDANTVINTLGGSTLDAVGKAQLLTSAFGGARSGSSIELLTQQVNQMKDALNGVNATSDKFASSWAATQQTAAYNTQQFNAAVQTLAIEFGDKLLPIFTRVVTVMSKGLVPAFDDISKAGAVIAGILGATIIPLVVSLATKFGFLEVVGNGFKFATPAVFAFGRAILLTMGWWVLAAAAIGVALYYIVTNWNSISTYIEGKMAPFVSLFQKMSERIGQILNSFGISGQGGGIIKWFTDTQDKVEFYSARLVQIIDDFMQKIKNKIAGIPNASWADALVGAYNRLKPAIDAVKKTLEPLLTQFQVSAQIIKTQIAPQWDAMTQQIKPFLKVIGDAAWPAFKKLLEEMAIAVAIVVAAIVTLIVGLISGFAKALPYVLQAIAAIIKVFKGLMEFITGIFTGNWRTAMEGLKEMVVGMYQAVINTFNALTHFISGFIEGVINLFLHLASTLVGHSIVPDMVNAIADWFNKMVGFVTTPVQKVYDFLTSTFTNAKNDVTKIVSDMVNSVMDLLHNIKLPHISIGTGKTTIAGHELDYPTFGVNWYQSGGVVPGPIGAPVFAMVHGGETINPIGGEGGSPYAGGQGGGGVTLNVNIGLYAGTETDKRNIAKSLYQALLSLAQSRHQTVSQMMGG